MTRKLAVMVFLLALIFMVMGVLTSFTHAESCPVYKPNCWLGWPNLPDGTPTPEVTEPAPIDWSGEKVVGVGGYRVFSNVNSLVLVEEESGDILLWLEFTYPQTRSDENVLLGAAGNVSVYLLTTGEYQINVELDGITKVMIFDALPVSAPQYSEF